MLDVEAPFIAGGKPAESGLRSPTSRTYGLAFCRPRSMLPEPHQGSERLCLRTLTHPKTDEAAPAVH